MIKKQDINEQTLEGINITEYKLYTQTKEDFFSFGKNITTPPFVTFYVTKEKYDEIMAKDHLDDSSDIRTNIQFIIERETMLFVDDKLKCDCKIVGYDENVDLDRDTIETIGYFIKVSLKLMHPPINFLENYEIP